MKKKYKSLLKGTGIYAIGTFGTKILAFLIVPLYTYYISTNDLGTYDVLISTIDLLSPIITLQISDAAYKWIIQSDSNTELYIRSTLQVLIINCFIASLLVFLAGQFFTIPYISYFVAVLVLSRGFNTMQKLLRGLKNQMLFALTGIFYTAVFLTYNVIQICIFGRGVECLFQGAVIAYLFAIGMIIVCERRIRVNLFKNISIPVIKEMYRFSIPLVPNYLNWWVINSSDRYIVAIFLGMSSNGILAVAHKFPTILQTILGLFTNSWQDVSIADKDKNAGTDYTVIFKTYSRFALSLLWPLIPATKVVVWLIMSTAYKESCNIIAFYYMGTVFQSFSSFYGIGYLKNNRTGKAFTTSVYGAIVNAVVNIVFIHVIGLQAAAVSTFIGFLVMWLVREKQNRNELGIKLRWFEIIGMTLAGVVVCLLSNMISWKYNIILFVFGCIGFVIVQIPVIKGLKSMLKMRLKK